jgi:[ribosomal protein S5]-alanine N-acetyltransferase
MFIRKKLKGKNIYLECLTKKNINKNYSNWLKDKKINKFLEVRFVKSEFSLNKIFSNIQTYNKSKNIVLFGIFCNNLHIGNIKILNDKNHKRSEIGILIGDINYWGKGVGSEAINLASNFAIKNFKAEFLFAGCYKSNIASIKSFKKAGWKLNSIIKNYWKLKNSREDWVLLSKQKK